MNVLIICRYFPPENKIGAVRPSRIAKYLNRYNDVEVSVLTVEPLGTDLQLFKDSYYGTKVYRVVVPSIIKRLNRTLKRNESVAATRTTEKQSNSDDNVRRIALKQKIRDILFVARERMLSKAYYSGAKRILKKNNITFDVVISTYNTEFGHNVGYWYKKNHPDVKWITDYRDPLWGSYSTFKQKKHGTAFVKRISKICDAITVVSTGIIDIHKDDFGGKPISLIHNGYDSEDQLTEDVSTNDKTVRLVYTGELYNGKRDLSPLFQAIYILQREHRIQPEDIEIVYAGKSGDSFASQISRFPQIKYTNSGFVSRNEALALQAGADLLILASWCEPNEKAVLTGKFFEYLQMRKPIICMISGSASGCRLTKIINEHFLGFSYEAVNKEMDQGLLCNYIEKQVMAKKDHGTVEFVGDDEFVKQFDYKSIAYEFYSIIKGKN